MTYPEKHKSIQECQWFGHSEHITTHQLNECGCTRCQQEIEQREFLSTLNWNPPVRREA